MKKYILLALIVSVSGCGSVKYTYDGGSYTGPDEFQSGVDATNREAHDQLVKELRVEAPLSSKQLLIALPSLDTIKSGYKLPNVLQVTPAQISARNNLSESTYKQYEMIAQVIKEIGIYSGVKTIESDGARLKPSSTETVLYLYVLPDQTSSQWYIDGTKQGVLAVNVDRGQPKLVGKIRSFVNSVKGYAIAD